MSSAEPLDLEFEYANPAMMKEYRDHIPLWLRDAAAYREAAREHAELDVAYGTKPRQRLDIFWPPGQPPGARSGAVALLIHGGYFQAQKKSNFSHLARGPNAHGITVAVAGYTLCPEVTVGEIISELQKAVAFVAKRFGKPVTVLGHSAGGHLAACMLATDWREVDATLDGRTVPSALPISGLFALEPLVATTINDKLRLDVAEARRLSPLRWPLAERKSVIAYVGGSESSEYRRQTLDYVNRLATAGHNATAIAAPGATHFTVIAPLAEPDSTITQHLVAITQGT